MKKKVHYMVVDDDVTNNLICEYNIKNFDKEAGIQLYTQPELALDSLKSGKAEQEIILFLDLNMPTMTGWEFLEKFADLDSPIKDQISIYILTSAIENGEDKAVNYPFLKGFFSKPLSKFHLEEVARSHKEISRA